ncbi:hypothetical protein NCS52_00384600 [Fusarium sp. LHS14.1]|nr:hypothetical protein NCS52_00384600 [Fusarium sp. LHS14.1]
MHSPLFLAYLRGSTSLLKCFRPYTCGICHGGFADEFDKVVVLYCENYPVGSWEMAVTASMCVMVTGRYLYECESPFVKVHEHCYRFISALKSPREAKKGPDFVGRVVSSFMIGVRNADARIPEPWGFSPDALAVVRDKCNLHGLSRLPVEILAIIQGYSSEAPLWYFARAVALRMELSLMHQETKMVQCKLCEVESWTRGDEGPKLLQGHSNYTRVTLDHHGISRVEALDEYPEPLSEKRISSAKYIVADRRRIQALKIEIYFQDGLAWLATRTYARLAMWDTPTPPKILHLGAHSDLFQLESCATSWPSNKYPSHPKTIDLSTCTGLTFLYQKSFREDFCDIQVHTRTSPVHLKEPPDSLTAVYLPLPPGEEILSMSVLRGEYRGAESFSLMGRRLCFFTSSTLHLTCFCLWPFNPPGLGKHLLSSFAPCYRFFTMGQDWKLINIDKKRQLRHIGQPKLLDILKSTSGEQLVGLLANPSWLRFQIPAEKAIPAKKRNHDSPLVNLPQNAIDMIVAILYECRHDADLICLSVTCSYFFRLISHMIQAAISEDIGQWAGDRLILIGERAVGYPPEIATVLERFQWDSDGTNPLYEMGEQAVAEGHHSTLASLVKEQPFEVWGRALDNVRERLDQKQEVSLPFKRLMKLLMHNPHFPSSHRPAVLRNLTTKQFISDDALARSNFSYSLGEVLLCYITWGEEAAQDERVRLPMKGEWAGHRFDITTREKVSGWDDVSQQVIKRMMMATREERKTGRRVDGKIWGI